jgi:beta-galactosidase
MNSTIPSPALWSPSSPNLYKIVTTVSVDGQPVDDYVDRFGVRTIVWSKDSGFILNNKRLGIVGINLHQDFGWVQAAVPTSRHYKIVEFIKDAGFNTMRCSHYPRDPSFYDACDELGLLLFVEAPRGDGVIRHTQPPSGTGCSAPTRKCWSRETITPA